MFKSESPLLQFKLAILLLLFCSTVKEHGEKFIPFFFYQVPFTNMKIVCMISFFLFNQANKMLSFSSHFDFQSFVFSLHLFQKRHLQLSTVAHIYNCAEKHKWTTSHALWAAFLLCYF